MNLKPILFLILCCTLTYCLPAQQTHSLTVEVSIADKLQKDFPEDGRFFLFMNAMARRSLITSWPSPGLNVYAKNMEGWKGAQAIQVDGDTDWTSKADFPLGAIPEGTYFVQLVWDHDREESRLNAPGNLYSAVTEVKVFSDQIVKISLVVCQVLNAG